MSGMSLGCTGDECGLLSVRSQEELQCLNCHFVGPLLLSNVKDVSTYSLEHLALESKLAFEEQGLKFRILKESVMIGIKSLK